MLVHCTPVGGGGGGVVGAGGRVGPVGPALVRDLQQVSPLLQLAVLSRPPAHSQLPTWLA